MDDLASLNLFSSTDKNSRRESGATGATWMSFNTSDDDDFEFSTPPRPNGNKLNDTFSVDSELDMSPAVAPDVIFDTPIAETPGSILRKDFGASSKLIFG